MRTPDMPYVQLVEGPPSDAIGAAEFLERRQADPQFLGHRLFREMKVL